MSRPPPKPPGYLIHDPDESELGHWLSEEPGAEWCKSVPPHTADQLHASSAMTSTNPPDWNPDPLVMLANMINTKRVLDAQPKPNWMLVAPDGRVWKDPEPAQILRALVQAVDLDALIPALQPKDSHEPE